MMALLSRLFAAMGFCLCFALFLVLAAATLSFDALAAGLAALKGGCVGLADGFDDLANAAAARGAKIRERLRASGWAGPEQAREK